MKKKFINILYSFSLLLFIIAFNFQHNPPEGWYQQFLPNLPNMQVSDIFFLDSLTGWIVTGNGEPNDTSGYILKTSNGGDNWNLKFTDFRDFSRVKFLDENTGFVSGGFATGAKIYKSTDGGESWFSLNIPGGGQIYFDDMSVLNEDTIWVVASNGFVGGVFRTTNGGLNWTLLSNPGDYPDKIYMYNSRIGFIGFNGGTPTTKRTTNGGLNWTTVLNEGFTDMVFIDSLLGWKCWGERDSIKKTTDGGTTWQKQLIPPSGGFFAISVINDLAVISADTLWGVGAVSNLIRGLIYISTDGGATWGYQLPDTSINIARYYHADFINKLNGWAYSISRGVHTVTGGIITSITQISSEIPMDFKLFQNYPNPFNSETKINYELRITSYVKLKVFDVTGRIIRSLVDERQNAGTYQYSFDASGLASGIYFCTIEVETEKGVRFIETKKMILQN